jgi:hypothetical protein
VDNHDEQYETEIPQLYAWNSRCSNYMCASIYVFNVATAAAGIAAAASKHGDLHIIRQCMQHVGDRSIARLLQGIA